MNQSLFHHSKQQEYCPQCGAPLQIKQGKKGLFLGCSAYPECDYLRPLQRSEHKVLKTLDEICPKCSNLLQLKQGSFGMFIGCSHYPECDFVVREESESEEKITCPECKTGHLIPRRGRQGKIFYGCDNFPKCKFSLPAKPYAVPCPTCHFPLSLLKSDNVERNGAKRIFQCANKTCRHIFEQ